MSTSIAQNIEALCQEQGIDRELVIEAIKEAVRAAAKKQFKGGEDIQVDWSPDDLFHVRADGGCHQRKSDRGADHVHLRSVR